MPQTDLARKVLHAYADLDGITNADCQHLVSESTKKMSIQPSQCVVLQEVLGAGSDGEITQIERKALSDARFSNDFADALAGTHGKKALYIRIKRLVEHRAQLMRNIDGVLISSTGNELMENDRALKEIGSKLKIALPHLRRLMSDSDPCMRASAVEAVTFLGELAKDAVPELALLVRGDNVTVARLAATALATIGPEAREAADDLAAVLSHEKDLVKRAAAHALGRIGAKKATPKLLSMLVDNNHWARANAAKALGELRAKEAVGRLMLALNDSNKLVAIQAANALGKIGDNAIVAAFPLGMMLGDPDVEVRRAAAKAIWRLGRNAYAAKEKLAQARKDNDYEVRQFASWSLENIKKRDPATRIAKR